MLLRCTSCTTTTYRLYRHPIDTHPCIFSLLPAPFCLSFRTLCAQGLSPRAHDKGTERTRSCGRGNVCSWSINVPLQAEHSTERTSPDTSSGQRSPSPRRPYPGELSFRLLGSDSGLLPSLGHVWIIRIIHFGCCSGRPGAFASQGLYEMHPKGPKAQGSSSGCPCEDHHRRYAITGSIGDTPSG